MMMMMKKQKMMVMKMRKINHDDGDEQVEDNDGNKKEKMMIMIMREMKMLKMMKMKRITIKKIHSNGDLDFDDDGKGPEKYNIVLNEGNISVRNIEKSSGSGNKGNGKEVVGECVIQYIEKLK
ncbi:conserved hypothetical protein [Ricinus communis]|uniref:Uncharacterized protein n=1 Tax=Ricinus communis TaxID=3988 RepID=B9SEU8_RICCO|nr:conserved hypothetical protein [Ricinus communis]